MSHFTPLQSLKGCEIFYTTNLFYLEKAREHSPEKFLITVVSSAIIAAGYKLDLMSHRTKSVWPLRLKLLMYFFSF